MFNFKSLHTFAVVQFICEMFTTLTSLIYNIVISYFTKLPSSLLRRYCPDNGLKGVTKYFLNIHIPFEISLRLSENFSKLP